MLGSLNWYYLELAHHKPATFTHKLKFILSPQLIVSLNNYACSLPPLANVNWSVFQSAFYWPCIYMTGELVPMTSSKSALETWYYSHCQCKSDKPCSWLLAHNVYIWMWQLLWTCHCCCLVSFLAFTNHPPHPCTLSTHPHIYAGPN